MMKKLGLKFVLAVVTPLLLSACQSSVGPGESGDTLVAVAVEESALPATVVDWPDYHRVLLGDTIQFIENGRFRRVRVERFVGISGVPEIQVVEAEGHREFDGGRITLIPMCPEDAACIPGGDLIPDGDGFRFDWEVVHDSVIAVHFRVTDSG